MSANLAARVLEKQFSVDANSKSSVSVEAYAELCSIASNIARTGIVLYEHLCAKIRSLTGVLYVKKAIVRCEISVDSGITHIARFEHLGIMVSIAYRRMNRTPLTGNLQSLRASEDESDDLKLTFVLCALSLLLAEKGTNVTFATSESSVCRLSIEPHSSGFCLHYLSREIDLFVAMPAIHPWQVTLSSLVQSLSLVPTKILSDRMSIFSNVLRRFWHSLHAILAVRRLHYQTNAPELLALIAEIDEIKKLEVTFAQGHLNDASYPALVDICDKLFLVTKPGFFGYRQYVLLCLFCENVLLSEFTSLEDVSWVKSMKHTFMLQYAMYQRKFYGTLRYCSPHYVQRLGVLLDALWKDPECVLPSTSVEEYWNAFLPGEVYLPACFSYLFGTSGSGSYTRALDPAYIPKKYFNFGPIPQILGFVPVPENYGSVSPQKFDWCVNTNHRVPFIGLCSPVAYYCTYDDGGSRFTFYTLTPSDVKKICTTSYDSLNGLMSDSEMHEFVPFNELYSIAPKHKDLHVVDNELFFAKRPPFLEYLSSFETEAVKLPLSAITMSSAIPCPRDARTCASTRIPNGVQVTFAPSEDEGDDHDDPN